MGSSQQAKGGGQGSLFLPGESAPPAPRKDGPWKSEHHGPALRIWRELVNVPTQGSRGDDLLACLVDHVATHGSARVRSWVDGLVAEARTKSNPTGWIIHGLRHREPAQGPSRRVGSGHDGQRRDLDAERRETARQERRRHLQMSVEDRLGPSADELAAGWVEFLAAVALNEVQQGLPRGTVEARIYDRVREIQPGQVAPAFEDEA